MKKEVISLSTVSLVKRAQSGDIEAFEQLVTLYQHKVFNLCCQITGNPNDAQDVAQETFIKAYRYLGSFRNESDFGTWLHRIAVNTWINEKKKMNRQPVVSIDQPLPGSDGEVRREVAATTGNPEEALERLEFQEGVRQALNQLSEEHRSVLILRELQGYSYDEIASMLDCSLGTVKSRINRARQSMREILNGFFQGGE